MKRLRSTFAVVMTGALVYHAQSPIAAYTTVGQQTLSAIAAVGTGSEPAPGSLVLNVPNILPFTAFFGKDIVIPVEVQGASGSSDLNLAFFYQLRSSAGTPIGGEVHVPIAFQPEPGRPNAFIGNAIVPAQNLEPVRQGGRIDYYFQARQGAQQAHYGAPGSPFQVQFTDTFSFPVTETGSVVIVPDTYLTDGKTSVAFAPGALSTPGTLVIRQEDLISSPSGPNGLFPIVRYNFDLQGTSLQREVKLTLTYPANPDGSLIGSNGNPQNLAPYWLQGPNWQVLGPRQWDSAMHTVSVPTTHFSSYALFLSGATSAADLRPRQRILTPNGDGINDTVDFSGITVSDGVHIFDLKGRRVRTLHSPSLLWDARDDDGRIVESGLYIYQYSAQGDRVSGVILIAK